jgi:hypothetical protein
MDRKGVAVVWPELSVEIILAQAALIALEVEGRWALRYPEVDGKNELPNYLSIIDASFLERVHPLRVTIIR